MIVFWVGITSYPQSLETFRSAIEDFEPQVGVSVFRDKGLASALSSVPSRQRFGIPPEEIIPLVGEPYGRRQVVRQFQGWRLINLQVQRISKVRCRYYIHINYFA